MPKLLPFMLFYTAMYFICITVKCNILPRLDFVQGTNDTFVFTNILGHPTVYRPTGISF